jgi:syntaxin 18
VPLRQGVVLIITEYLQRVAASFDSCREVRFKKVLAEAEHKRRRAPPPSKKTTKTTETTHASSASASASASTSTSYQTSGEHDPQQQQQQQRRLSSEGDVLVDELTGLVEQVRRAEGKVVEMSALSSLFASHVQSQAQQIERLYTAAAESTRNLEGGNVELRKTTSRRGDSQLIVAVILFVATFGLLFLDWMSG